MMYSKPDRLRLGTMVLTIEQRNKLDSKLADVSDHRILLSFIFVVTSNDTEFYNFRNPL